MNVMRWMIVGVLSLAGLACTGCQTNAATGERHFMTLSRNDEIQLGEEAAPEFTEQFGGAVADEELQRYIGSIGARMARKTEGENPTLPWEFTLLDSSVVNAFALPGGKVFITRGLAARLDDEAELAGRARPRDRARHRAARESAHLLEHDLEHRSRRRRDGGLGVGDDSDVEQVGQLAIPALAIGGQVVQLKYGRDDELEADRLGIRYMAKLRLRPRAGQRDVMQVLKSLSEGSSRQPEWLSTHPYPERRIQRINDLLETEYAGVSGERWATRYQRDFLSATRAAAAAAPRRKRCGRVPRLRSGSIGCSCGGHASDK